MAHQMARQGINFEDINYDTDFNTMKAYGISKLANVLHAKELANRLNNTGISVYVLHPGMYDIQEFFNNSNRRNHIVALEIFSDFLTNPSPIEIPIRKVKSKYPK